MEEYVTLEELKSHLSIDFDEDPEIDSYIKGLIMPVQLSIEAYLNRSLSDLVEDGKIDRRIWHAIRIIVANLFASRESVAFAQSYQIPDNLILLLKPLRKYT